MTPSAADPLLILAMDHRDSFEKLFGDAPDPETVRAAKSLIYQGVRDVHLPRGHVGVLVDEHLGTAVLTAARADGLVLAMPVEKSGQKLFHLEYGTETVQHIEQFDPAYVKVLVRMNPADDPDDTAGQLARLADLSTLLAELGKPFLYELLVPPTDEQKGPAYDRDVRPGLVAQVIRANQEAGVEPTLWKIEGLETTEAAELVVAAAKAEGRTADCIVLGRDAPQEVLDHWLTIAAPVDGFVGFAIGRSIWEDPLKQHLQDGDDARMAAAIKANYLHYATSYLDGAGQQ